MKKNRLIAFALSVSLLLGASACGKPAKTVSELIAEENAILDQHQELWTTALNSLDKDKLSQSTQSTNYADVLDLAIKNVKDQLSDEDYKTLTDDAAKVRKLEDQLQELPPEEGTTTSASDTFPAFEGKDLDGNAVDSSQYGGFPCEQRAERGTNTGIDCRQRQRALENPLRTQVFAEERIAHAEFVCDKYGQQHHHDQQHRIFHIAERLQPFGGQLGRGDFVQQLLKPAERAQKAADKPSEQHAEQD